MKISGTIITLNEEPNIARAIASLGLCDDIIVLDSGSTDRTVEIARQLGARVVAEPWRGYAAQKNLAAELATHDWILSLDADEMLSDELVAEIQELRKGEPKFDAYSVPRLARYLGRWIWHGGWYPDRKIRLYDRRKARWVGEFVHESVKCSGTVGSLQSRLVHFTCNSVSDHMRSLDRYTTLAAQEIIAKHRKVTVLKLVLDPPWTFFRSYCLKLGFLDGVEGFIIAQMAAFYTFAKYCKVWHLRKSES